MRTVGLPSFTQPTQSYAIISYPAQPAHQAQDIVTQPMPSNTAISDQPLKIDHSSQLTQMKVCDSVVSLPVNNPVESSLPLYNVGSTHPPVQLPPTTLANRVPVVQQQQGVNIGVIDGSGLYYVIAAPSSNQPTVSVAQPNLQIGIPAATAASNSASHVASVPERSEPAASNSITVVNSTNTLNNTALAQSVAQIAALLSTCHVSIIPTDDLPTAVPFSIPAQLSSSSALSSATTFAALSNRSNVNVIRSVQPCDTSVVFPVPHEGDSTAVGFGNSLSYGISMRGSGFFDYPVSQDSQLPRHRYSPIRNKTVAERTYSNPTTGLWTPEKHEAFVAVYESLVNANEKITQGAIFKEMKKRYPGFQLTLRQIQSKLQKYRLRLNQEGTR